MMQTCVAHPLRFLQKVGLPNSKPLEILPLIFLKAFSAQPAAGLRCREKPHHRRWPLINLHLTRLLSGIAGAWDPA